jgi:hypothetical protein
MDYTAGSKYTVYTDLDWRAGCHSTKPYSSHTRSHVACCRTHACRYTQPGGPHLAAVRTRPLRQCSRRVPQVRLAAVVAAAPYGSWRRHGCCRACVCFAIHVAVLLSISQLQSGATLSLPYSGLCTSIAAHRNLGRPYGSWRPASCCQTHVAIHAALLLAALPQLIQDRARCHARVRTSSQTRSRYLWPAYTAAVRPAPGCHTCSRALGSPHPATVRTAPAAM